MKLNINQSILVFYVGKKISKDVLSEFTIDWLNELISSQEKRADICILARKLTVTEIRNKHGEVILNKSQLKETITSLEILWNCQYLAKLTNVNN